MAELTVTEKSTIEAVVDGMQRRALKRRKAARQGWAFLLTGALSIPIIASAFDGMISLPTAAMRIVIALVITTGIVSMVGSLFDSYQGQAAIRTVETAVMTARRQADEAAADDHGAAPSGAEPETTSPAPAAGGSNDGADDER